MHTGCLQELYFPFNNDHYHNNAKQFPAEHVYKCSTRTCFSAERSSQQSRAGGQCKVSLCFLQLTQARPVTRACGTPCMSKNAELASLNMWEAYWTYIMSQHASKWFKWAMTLLCQVHRSNVFRRVRASLELSLYIHCMNQSWSEFILIKEAGWFDLT